MNSVNLPKWPAIVLVGEPVTRAQAQEIIVRCSAHSGFYSNFEEDLQTLEKWVKSVDKKGVVSSNSWSLDVNWKKFNGLPIHYFDLANRVCGSYVGGSYGWMNWDGRVEMANHNIGKWPTCEEVMEEWKIIAETFPYLDLTFQLFNQEWCEEEYPMVPLVEFVVKNGSVEMREPSVDFDYRCKTRDWEFEAWNVLTRTTELHCEQPDFTAGLHYAKGATPHPSTIKAYKEAQKWAKRWEKIRQQKQES